MTPNQIAAELGKSGFCICPYFLSPQMLISAREDLIEIQADGGFKRAGVGHGTAQEVRDQVRSDHIYWLERSRANEVQTNLWAEFDLLKIAFNRTLYLGLTDFQTHYANYPAGGFYKKHIDSFSKDNSRMVSLVLYLNENWQANHGGELRIYNNNPASLNPHQDVNPIGGTLVCFLSQDFEHEVLISHTGRLSLTGWFVN